MPLLPNRPRNNPWSPEGSAPHGALTPVPVSRWRDFPTFSCLPWGKQVQSSPTFRSDGRCPATREGRPLTAALAWGQHPGLLGPGPAFSPVSPAPRGQQPSDEPQGLASVFANLLLSFLLRVCFFDFERCLLPCPPKPKLHVAL